MPSIKNCRSARHIDSSVAARRNIRSEINKATKKMNHLLSLYEKGKLRANQERTLRNPDGSEERRVKANPPRYQGIQKGGERHKRLQSHIQKLKNRLKELEK